MAITRTPQKIRNLQTHPNPALKTLYLHPAQNPVPNPTIKIPKTHPSAHIVQTALHLDVKQPLNIIELQKKES